MPADLWDETSGDSEEWAADPAAAPPGLLTFQPHLWRYYSAHMLIFAGIPWAIVAAISWLTGDYLYIPYFLLWVVGVAFLQYRKYVTALPALSIQLSDTGVSGPGGLWSWSRMRQTIPLDELDRVRSARRRFVDRLLARQYFYSTSGNRIYLARFAFSRHDVHRLLALLRLK